MPTPALFWSCLHQWSASLCLYMVQLKITPQWETNLVWRFYSSANIVCVMNVNSREKFRIKSAAPSAGRTGKEQETKGCDKKKKNIKVIICLMHNVHICKLLTTLFIHPQLLSTYKASDDIPLFCFRTSPSFNKTQRCGGQHDSFESYGWEVIKRWRLFLGLS